MSAIIDTDLNSKIVIGYIGRIEYAKGIDVFIGALPDDEKVETIVIGSGSSEKLLDNVNCHLLGFLDEAIKYISGIDIVVVPSRSRVLVALFWKLQCWGVRWLRQISRLIERLNPWGSDRIL